MKALILCAALTALAAPAFAASPIGNLRPVAGLHNVFETTVPLGDLDLNRVSGAKVAFDRIKFAANRVCGPRPNPVDVVARSKHRACVGLAVDNAVVALDAPLVAAHLQRGETARLAAR
jgi:UrcA family protein